MKASTGSPSIEVCVLKDDVLSLHEVIVKSRFNRGVLPLVFSREVSEGVQNIVCIIAHQVDQSVHLCFLTLLF